MRARKAEIVYWQSLDDKQRLIRLLADLRREHPTHFQRRFADKLEKILPQHPD